MPANIKAYFRIVQELYRLGFKTIVWDPNLTTKPTSGPFHYFEVVFRKSNMEGCS